MSLTLHDITPIGLCIATQDLFDTKRFLSNFCDNLLLRAKDQDLGPKLLDMKRELNSMSGRKFLEGHKTAIISNLDKIMGIVSSRYTRIDMRSAEDVIFNCKELMKKVLDASNFDDIAKLEPEFRSKVTLPVYQLFIDYMKKSKVSVI